MKTLPLAFAVAIAGSLAFASASLAQQSEFEIWPGELPAGSVEFSAEKVAELKGKTTEERIAFVDRATLTAFPAPADSATGCGVVICPGGAYNKLAWPKEGLEVAEWFNSIGVSAFVLKYRVPRRSETNFHREPLQDLQRAIRVLRHDAKKWKIDPQRIGVLGFSAGGHLTVMAGLHDQTNSYERVDEADEVSARPDFICPIYAAYLGEDYNDRDSSELGSMIKVTENAPPTFLAVTWDDAMRGAQAASLFARLKEHKVPAELHVYSKGGHGYGIRPSDNSVSNWHHLLGSWLGASGFLSDGDEK